MSKSKVNAIQASHASHLSRISMTGMVYTCWKNRRIVFGNTLRGVFAGIIVVASFYISIVERYDVNIKAAIYHVVGEEFDWENYGSFPIQSLITNAINDSGGGMMVVNDTESDNCDRSMTVRETTVVLPSGITVSTYEETEGVCRKEDERPADESPNGETSNVKNELPPYVGNLLA